MGFVECLKLFKDDAETRALVLIGEIGGREEEKASEYLSGDDYGKPVIALVVGRHAPKGRRMGHAGTLSVLGALSANEKIERLKSSGVLIAKDADDVVDTVLKALDQN